MHDDQLAAIEAELARQDAAFAESSQLLTSAEALELHLPEGALDELDELTTSRTCTALRGAMPAYGIRG